MPVPAGASPYTAGRTASAPRSRSGGERGTRSSRCAAAAAPTTTMTMTTYPRRLWRTTTRSITTCPSRRWRKTMTTTCPCRRWRHATRMMTTPLSPQRKPGARASWSLGPRTAPSFRRRCPPARSRPPSRGVCVKRCGRASRARRCRIWARARRTAALGHRRLRAARPRALRVRRTTTTCRSPRCSRAGKTTTRTTWTWNAWRWSGRSWQRRRRVRSCRGARGGRLPKFRRRTAASAAGPTWCPPCRRSSAGRSSISTASGRKRTTRGTRSLRS
mmetsp:Transcript_21288/g.73461  ORF Transcript_21288/g.73461 Transcript_21288/m.73461 type:complete len:274 (-) Transcript_21288:650-1471(-)